MKACADKPAQAVATCVASIFVAAVLRFARGKNRDAQGKTRRHRERREACGTLGFQFLPLGRSECQSPRESLLSAPPLVPTQTAQPSYCSSIPHCGIYHSVVFIESRQFTRRRSELAGGSAEDVLRAIQNDLMANPEKGSVIPGLNGIRKARIANPGRGKGKRGGYRYMHLYLEHRNHIHLLFVLDKGEQEDLTNEQRKALRAMVVELRGLL